MAWAKARCRDVQGLIKARTSVFNGQDIQVF